MKLFKCFFYSLSISLTYSFNLKNLYEKRNQDTNTSNNALEQLCFENPINECIYGGIREENYEKICNSVNSKKCQNFYSDPLRITKDCSNLDQNLIDKYMDKINIGKKENMFFCEKDENSNKCPMTDYVIKSNAGVAKTEIAINIVNALCKSKKCTNAAINYLDSFMEAIMKATNEKFDTNSTIIVNYEPKK